MSAAAAVLEGYRGKHKPLLAAALRQLKPGRRLVRSLPGLGADIGRSSKTAQRGMAYLESIGAFIKIRGGGGFAGADGIGRVNVWRFNGIPKSYVGHSYVGHRQSVQHAPQKMSNKEIEQANACPISKNTHTSNTVETPYRDRTEAPGVCVSWKKGGERRLDAEAEAKFEQLAMRYGPQDGDVGRARRQFAQVLHEFEAIRAHIDQTAKGRAKAQRHNVCWLWKYLEGRAWAFEPAAAPKVSDEARKVAAIRESLRSQAPLPPPEPAAPMSAAMRMAASLAARMKGGRAAA